MEHDKYGVKRHTHEGKGHAHEGDMRMEGYTHGGRYARGHTRGETYTRSDI